MKIKRANSKELALIHTIPRQTGPNLTRPYLTRPYQTIPHRTTPLPHWSDSFNSIIECLSGQILASGDAI